MATVIDELVVNLGLDPTKFVVGTVKGKAALVELKDTVDKSSKSLVKLKDTAEVSSKSVAGGAKKMEDAFAGVGTRMLELATLFTGGLGIAAFMGYVVQGAAELGRFAKVLDTNAQEMWAWDQAGAQVGARSGEITGSWQKLVHTFNDFSIGLPAANAKFIRFFAEQGVQFVDSRGKMKSMTDVYMQLNKVVQGMDPARAESYLRGLGLEPGAINLILQPTERLVKSLEDMKKNAPSPEQIAAAQKAQASFNVELSKTKSFALDIANILLPALNTLMLNLGNIIEAFKDLPKYLKALENSSFVKWMHQGQVKKEDWLERLAHPDAGSTDNGAIGQGPGATPRGSESGAQRGLRTVPGGGSERGSAAPGGGSEQGTNLEGPAPSGRQNVRSQNAQQLRDAGLPESAVAALQANIHRESGFNASSRVADQPRFGGEAHYAHGLYQEGGTEWNKYDAWLKQNHPGKSWTDPRLQTEFLMQNLKKSYPKVWEKLNDPSRSAGQKAMDFQSGYLRPAQLHRGDAALAEQYLRNPPGPPVGSTSAWGNNARAVPWLTSPASMGLFPGGQQAGNTTNNSSSAETHVGSVTVQTKATDAYGIASDMKAAIERVGSVGNMNNGPN